MKTIRICPKCNRSNILHFKGEVIGEGYGDNSIITGFISAVPVDRYVCTDCGFTEEWIDRKYMDVLKKSKKANKEDK